MIEAVISGVIYIKQIFYYGLVLSYGIGKGIVFGFNYILSVCQDIFNSGKDLLTVMSEDFTFFLNDILQKISFIALGATTALHSSFNSVLYVFELAISSVELIFKAFYTIFTSAWTAVFKLFSYVGLSIAYIKNLLILCGLGIWFLIKLVPLILVHIITLPVCFIGVVFKELNEFFTYGVYTCITSAKDAFYFIVDMPIEAVAGLIAGACIIYLLLKFNFILYRTAKQKCRFIMLKFYQILNQIWQAGRVEAKESVDVPSEFKDNYLSLDGCCVICQEREKCILLLPCKHLCLCDECSETVKRHNRRCPICRSYLQKTMKIYL